MTPEALQDIRDRLRAAGGFDRKLQNANGFIVLRQADGQTSYLPLAWAAHVIAGGDPGATRAAAPPAVERRLKADLVAAGWRQQVAGHGGFADMFERYLGDTAEASVTRSDWAEGRRKLLAGKPGAWEFWTPPTGAATREDVLGAMDRLAAGETPEGFRDARLWFVRHPETGAMLPAKQVWGLATGQTGGAFTAHQARDALRRLGFDLPGPDQPAPEIAESPASLDALPDRFEGAERQVTRNIKERDRAARQDAEAYWRARNGGRLLCEGCRIDFGATYGARGEGFMHFHHRRPLAEATGPRAINGATDLVPLCPNCHAMVHRGETVWDIAELQANYRRQP